ncbi:MAG: NAD(P)-binding domain-containing protein [Candidatus Thiodiazotropha sp.]
MPKRIAIIGAGASGLIMARYTLKYGGIPVVFEKHEKGGGIWCYDPTGTIASKPAYPSLRTNSSRHVMHFSGFPFPEGEENYPSRHEVEEYLRQYSDYHKLGGYINTNSNVEKITKSANGKWDVALSTGEVFDAFDNVVVCSGQYKTPKTTTTISSNLGNVPIMHSAHYRGADSIQATRVLVVGIGSSGTDIATELAKNGKEVAIWIPSSTWIIPKEINNKPYDFYLTNLALRFSPETAQKKFEELVCEEYERLGIDTKRLTDILQSKPMDFSRSRLTVSSELPALIENETVKVIRDISQIDMTHKNSNTATSFTPDLVIEATGFKPDFPFLQDDCQPYKGMDLALYKHVFHPQIDGIAYLGMCGIVGAIFPGIELQASWVASVFLGDEKLPSISQRTDSVNNHLKASQESKVRGSREIQVYYMEKIAKEHALGEIEIRKEMVNDSLCSPVYADMYFQ